MKVTANYANSANYQETQGFEGYYKAETGANSCEFSTLSTQEKVKNSHEFASKKQPKHPSNPHDSYNFAEFAGTQLIDKQKEDEKNKIVTAVL